MPGIECALWPVLYPSTSYCESALPNVKDSTLHAFRFKLLSEISSYNNNFKLLQFQFDRWMYCTIMGAATTGAANLDGRLSSTGSVPTRSGALETLWIKDMSAVHVSRFKATVPTK